MAVAPRRATPRAERFRLVAEIVDDIGRTDCALAHSPGTFSRLERDADARPGSPANAVHPMPADFTFHRHSSAIDKRRLAVVATAAANIVEP